MTCRRFRYNLQSFNYGRSSQQSRLRKTESAISSLVARCLNFPASKPGTGADVYGSALHNTSSAAASMFLQ